MSPELAGIITGLEGKKVGNCYMAKCPAHDDHNPSLSISDRNGKILVKCFAGCEQRDVIAALKGLGLWDSEPKRQERIIKATYDYNDERSELLYQVVRFEPKDFRPRYPDGRGGWIWKKHPRQVLYRLREVLEAAVVFVVEGEKDVETLRSYGFCATTAPGGAKAPWLPEFTKTLAGKEIILVPDNDKPGWDRVKTIARALLGHAARILILDDIHRHGCKDISEWFGRGHSECELIAMLEGVHAV